MTAPGVAGSTAADQSPPDDALARFLHPAEPARFRQAVFDRAPLHLAAADRVAGPVTDRTEIEGWLAMPALWTARTLQLYRNGERVPEGVYCDQPDPNQPGILRPRRATVQRHLDQGDALLLAGIDELTPRLAALSRALEQGLGGRVAINLYWSRPETDAFAAHFDGHHVFALQVEGRKRWTIFRDRETHPIEGAPVAADRVAGLTPAGDVMMAPGDLLYLPRGLVHRARAEDGPSIHLAIGLTERTGLDLLGLIAQIAAHDPDFRAGLPLAGTDGDRFAARVAALLGKLGPLYQGNRAAVDRAIAAAQAGRPDRGETVRLSDGSH